MTDMTDLTLGIGLVATVAVAFLLLGFSIGRWRHDQVTAPDAKDTAQADPAPTVGPVSSVPLPGTAPLYPTPPTRPAQPRLVLSPAHAAVLPGPQDTGRHHRSFDPDGVQSTRIVAPTRRKTNTP